MVTLAAIPASTALMSSGLEAAAANGATLADTNGKAIEWWLGSPEKGFHLKQTGCIESTNVSRGDCVDCVPTADMYEDDEPNYPKVLFKPFEQYVKLDRCAQWDVIQHYQDAVATLQAQKWTRAAEALITHPDSPNLNTHSTVVPGASPGANLDGMNPQDAVQALLDARGRLSRTNTVLIMSEYVLVGLEAVGMVEWINGRPYGPNRTLIIADAGFPRVGPNGSVPPAGHGWIYAIEGVPVVAFHELQQLFQGEVSLDNPSFRKAMYSHECECYEPMARIEAIVGWNTCHAFAAPVDVRGGVYTATAEQVHTFIPDPYPDTISPAEIKIWTMKDPAERKPRAIAGETAGQNRADLLTWLNALP